MSKAGQPSKYKPEYCEELIGLMSIGISNIGASAKWCIDHSTFYQWRKDHKEFEAAYQQGLVQSCAYYETLLQGMAEGKVRGDFKALKSMMANKFKDLDWKFVETEVSNSTININNMNVLKLENKTTEQIDKMILEELADQKYINLDQPKELEYDHTFDIIDIDIDTKSE